MLIEDKDSPRRTDCTKDTKCLVYELKKLKLLVEVEKPIQFNYEDMIVDNGYRVDIMVDHEIIIELKSVKVIKHIHVSQLITYLKDGIRRIVY